MVATYRKVDGLKNLMRMGLNVHDNVITNNIVEAMDAVRKFGRFTVRTDININTTEGWGNGTQLPFIMQKRETENTDLIQEQLRDLIYRGYMLIITDGIKHDEIQDYNAVATIYKNGDYKVEVSTKKVPLRKMYSYDGIFIAEGNTCDNVWNTRFYGNVDYDRKSIIKDMQELYTKEIYGRAIEFTKYPIDVGIRKERLVFWQIRN